MLLLGRLQLLALIRGTELKERQSSRPYGLPFRPRYHAAILAKVYYGLSGFRLGLRSLEPHCALSRIPLADLHPLGSLYGTGGNTWRLSCRLELS